MRIIYRRWYFTGMLGLGLSIFGGYETRISIQSGHEPIAVTLADLENGRRLPQPYVRLAEHVALEPLGVELKWRHTNFVRKVLYPLVNAAHPLVQVLSVTQRVDRAALPGLADAHVFAMKTGELASAPLSVDSAEGTVFDAEGLSADEWGLVQRIAPGVDRARVRVLEIGRRPWSLGWTISSLVAGVTLIVVGAWMFVSAGRRRARDDDLVRRMEGRQA